MQLADTQTVGHAVTSIYVQHILDGTTLIGLTAFGYIVNLQPVATTTFSEEHHGVMHGGRINLLYEVVITRSCSFYTDSATILCLELSQWNTLYISQMRDGYDDLVVSIEVLGIELFCAGKNLCTTLVAKLILNLDEFVLHYLTAKLVIGKNLVVVLDLLHQLVVFCMQFLLIQTCKLSQTHIYDGL